MSRAICVALLCGLVAAAHAAPGDDPTAGRAVFTGATMPGAPQLELNPAAFGNGPTNELFLGSSLVLDRYAINLVGATGVREVEVSPGLMLAAIRHLGERFIVGFELNSPPGERFVGGHEQLRYYTLGGFRRTYRGVAGVEFRASSRVSVGVSFRLQTEHLKLRYALDKGLENGSTDIGDPANAERYSVDVKKAISDFETVVNFGILVRLARDTWLGVAYHTPPDLDVQSSLDGSMVVVRAPSEGGDTVRGNATVLISQPASVDAELRSRVMPDLDLHVGLRWQDLSRFQSFSVRGYGSTFMPNNIAEWTERPRGFHDPLALWAGVEQVGPADRWHFGGRLGLETSAVTNVRTSPLTIAGTSITADVGVQLSVPPFVLEATYGFQYFPTVTVKQSAFDPQARLDCIASGFDYSTPACESTRLGYAIPSAAGDYSRMEHAFRFGLRYEIP